MDETKAAFICFFLLCVISDMQTCGHTLDVCATCHVNATCDNKSDSSGKVCNCKYGFVGNGRTFCQDKDECQIGATKICGQHTTCHNTYGSYYCTCLSGYSPSNNMTIFIPNDGTHCQDIDECRVEGLCGEGGQCTNLDGSFQCSCQLGYRVHHGAEFFNPHRDKAFCKVVDCGQPVLMEDTQLRSTAGTTYGSVAVFGCDEGFVWKRGDNTSQCGADGLWRGPNMVCEAVECGPPPAFPHSLMLWNQSFRMDTEVFYQCNTGYQNTGQSNVSTCTAAGLWEGAPVICTEILCGHPPVVEFTEQVWSGNSTPGSTVLYRCIRGFYKQQGYDVSICSENGQWSAPSLSCQEILCGNPPVLPHTGQVWNGTSTPGSTVNYYCIVGFYHTEGNDLSLCTNDGYWTEANISCKEVDCGVPPDIAHSDLLWDRSSTVGSRVIYQCNAGYHSVGGSNRTVCTGRGEWDDVSLLCQEIDCREPVFKPHAQTIWDGSSHFGSVVIYECDEGYYTKSSRNYSVCGENGMWEDIDLWCEEVSCGPPLTIPHTNLLWTRTTGPGSTALYECMEGFYQESGDVLSTCLTWGEWARVSITCKAKCGPVPVLDHSEVVWHNRSVVVHRCVDGYHSWRGSNVSLCSSSGVWQTATLKCIVIQPPITQLNVSDGKCIRWKAEKYEEDTEVYKVTLTGTRDYERVFRDQRKKFLSSKDDWLEVCLNLLPVTNYSISITALSVRFTATTTTSTGLTVPPVPAVYYREYDTPVPTLRLRRSPSTLDPISLYQIFVIPVEGVLVFDCSSSSKQYLAAQMHVTHVRTEMNFTVGDGRQYGGFFNAPLENGRNYYIFLRAVSQWKRDFQSSCVVWAKVQGTSYVLRVSSLSAAAAVGLVAIATLAGYCYVWFSRRHENIPC